MQPASSTLGEEIPHDSSSASSSSSTEAGYQLSGPAFCGHVVDYAHVFLLYMHRIINNNVNVNSTRLHLSFDSSFMLNLDHQIAHEAAAILLLQQLDAQEGLVDSLGLNWFSPVRWPDGTHRWATV